MLVKLVPNPLSAGASGGWSGKECREALAEGFEPPKIAFTVREVEVPGIPASVLTGVLDADLALFTMVQREPAFRLVRPGEPSSSKHRTTLGIGCGIVERPPSNRQGISERLEIPERPTDGDVARVVGLFFFT
jgi:hypothetical protein